MSSHKKYIECPYCQSLISCDENADFSKSIRSHCSKSKLCKAAQKRGIDNVSNTAKKQKYRDIDIEHLQSLRDEILAQKHAALYNAVSLDVQDHVVTDEPPTGTGHVSICENIGLLDDTDDKSSICIEDQLENDQLENYDEVSSCFPTTLK